MRKNNIKTELSDVQIEKEIRRTALKSRRFGTVRRVVACLIVFCAVCVLATVFWFPVYQITGNSMQPYLESGQLVLACRIGKPEYSDVIALYYGGQTLIKRVIGLPGDWISINEQGQVFVNDSLIEENYLTETVLGTSDITYPYLVPENCYFVMGDHRAVSLDSRMSAMGCINEGKIAGKIIFRIWPLSKMDYMG